MPMMSNVDLGLLGKFVSASPLLHKISRPLGILDLNLISDLRDKFASIVLSIQRPISRWIP